MTKTAETQQRLDRIESKIDKLAEAIISLARAEEKLVQLENDKKFLMEKMVKFEERLLQVERNTSETASSLSFITRFFWIGMSAIGATVIGMWFSRK
jgi:phosphoglycerate-specific signal transduction histidine kinase